MVKMRGSTRIFDTNLIIENAASTSTARRIDVYGISAMSELQDVVLNIKPVVASTGAATTIAVYSYIYNPSSDAKMYTLLATVNLKVLDSSGVKQNPSAAWTFLGSYYSVVYDGTDFVLCNTGSNSGGGSANVEELTNAEIDTICVYD